MQRHAAAVLAFAVLAAVTPAQHRGREADPPKLAHFTFEQGTFKSDKARSGEPGYGIYLPKGYADEANKDTRYPWIVWLPGFGGFGEFQGGGGAEVLDALAGEGKIPPLALVVFRSPVGRTTYFNGEPGGDIEDLIAQDLVGQMQDKYRLQTDRKQRALMGVSMGGMGALKIAMHHAAVFGAVAVHSAAILPADPAELPQRYARQAQMMLDRGLDKVFGDPIEKAKWAHEMPLGLVASMKPEDFKGLQIYFDAGTEDRYGFCEPNERLDQAMTGKGIAHLFHKVEGGGHAWNSPKMKECLTASLQFVGACFRGVDPMPKVDDFGPKGGKDGKAEPGKEKESKEKPGAAR